MAKAADWKEKERRIFEGRLIRNGIGASRLTRDPDLAFSYHDRGIAEQWAGWLACCDSMRRRGAYANG